MKPHLHAESSAKTFGGKPEDYLEIHNLLDSSKAAMCDNRHRALTHNAWFIGVILERIFGVVITNSDGKKVSVRDIGEQHVLEDYRGKFVPSAQDWLSEIEFQSWMDNGDGEPGSMRKVRPAPAKSIERILRDFPTRNPNHKKRPIVADGNHMID